MANAIQFSPTNIFRGEQLPDDALPMYEVTESGQHWGHVTGEKGQFRAISQHGFTWGPNRRSRKHAVDAAKTAELIEPEPETPDNAVKYRVTEHNFDKVIRPGDLIVGARELGRVKSVRLTNDRYRNAMVVGEKGRDILGLPSTVYIIR